MWCCPTSFRVSLALQNVRGHARPVLVPSDATLGRCCCLSPDSLSLFGHVPVCSLRAAAAQSPPCFVHSRGGQGDWWRSIIIIVLSDVGSLMLPWGLASDTEWSEGKPTSFSKHAYFFFFPLHSRKEAIGGSTHAVCPTEPRVFWEPFRKHPVCISVLLLEARLSWHDLLICCRPGAAVTALCRPSQGWLCCFFFLFPRSSLRWHRPELQRSSVTFLYNPMLPCGWCPLALLPSVSDFTVLDHAYDDLSAPQVSPFKKNTKTLRNLWGFVFPRVTCLQELFGHLRLVIWYVCIASLAKKDLRLYFYLLCHRHHPWLSGDLSFVSDSDCISVFAHWF